MVGKTLSHYNIIEELRLGGMGIVYMTAAVPEGSNDVDRWSFIAMR